MIAFFMNHNTREEKTTVDFWTFMKVYRCETTWSVQRAFLHTPEANWDVLICEVLE